MLRQSTRRNREILEGCQVGGIAMVSQTTAPQVTFMPELAVFDIPMLFDNLDIARKLYRVRLERAYHLCMKSRLKAASFRAYLLS